MGKILGPPEARMWFERLFEAVDTLPSLGCDELCMPFGLDESQSLTNDNRWLLVTRRLCPGASIDQARTRSMRSAGRRRCRTGHERLRHHSHRGER
jgi:hypothetical protein